jgi:hypothetical protein
LGFACFNFHHFDFMDDMVAPEDHAEPADESYLVASVRAVTDKFNPLLKRVVNEALKEPGQPDSVLGPEDELMRLMAKSLSVK